MNWIRVHSLSLLWKSWWQIRVLNTRWKLIKTFKHPFIIVFTLFRCWQIFNSWEYWGLHLKIGILSITVNTMTYYTGTGLNPLMVGGTCSLKAILIVSHTFDRASISLLVKIISFPSMFSQESLKASVLKSCVTASLESSWDLFRLCIFSTISWPNSRRISSRSSSVRLSSSESLNASTVRAFFALGSLLESSLSEDAELKWIK